MTLVFFAGDCPNCEEDQINLTPATYKAINEGIAVNEIATSAAAAAVLEDIFSSALPS